MQVLIKGQDQAIPTNFLTNASGMILYNLSPGELVGVSAPLLISSSLFLTAHTSVMNPSTTPALPEWVNPALRPARHHFCSKMILFYLQWQDTNFTGGWWEHESYHQAHKVGENTRVQRYKH